MGPTSRSRCRCRPTRPRLGRLGADDSDPCRQIQAPQALLRHVSGVSRTPHSRVASSAAQAVSVKCLSYTCVSLSLSHPRAPRRSPCPAPARPRPRQAPPAAPMGASSHLRQRFDCHFSERLPNRLVSGFRVKYLLPSRASASESRICFRVAGTFAPSPLAPPVAGEGPLLGPGRANSSLISV